MPTLTVTDLRDPAPSVPGPAHRAAVAVRARQLTRRRRFTQVGAAAAVIVVLAVGGVAISSSGSNEAGPVGSPATVTGSTTSTPVSTLTVTLTGDEKSVTVDADPSGTFSVSDLPPGDYIVEWKYETSGPAPSDGVDIGTALSGGRTHVSLGSGDNTVRIPLS